MEKLLKEVEELNANVPDGIVKDAGYNSCRYGFKKMTSRSQGLRRIFLIFGETVRTRKQLSRCSLSLQIWNLKIFLKNAKKK